MYNGDCVLHENDYSWVRAEPRHDYNKCHGSDQSQSCRTSIEKKKM